MKLIIHKPYIIFWVLIPLMMIYGFFQGDETLDINIHDTYYVIIKLQIWYFLSHIFAIFGILYWLLIFFNRKIIRRLTSIHVFTTIIGILLLTIISPLFAKEAFQIVDNREENILITESIVLFIIIIAQVLFLINLSIGLYKKNEVFQK